MYLGDTLAPDSLASRPGPAAQLAGLVRACTAMSGRAGARWVTLAPGDTVLGAMRLDYDTDAANARQRFDSVVAAIREVRGSPAHICEGAIPTPTDMPPRRYAVAEWVVGDSARLAVRWNGAPDAAAVSTLLTVGKSRCDTRARA